MTNVMDSTPRHDTPLQQEHPALRALAGEETQEARLQQEHSALRASAVEEAQEARSSNETDPKLDEIVEPKPIRRCRFSSIIDVLRAPHTSPAQANLSSQTDRRASVASQASSVRARDDASLDRSFQERKSRSRAARDKLWRLSTAALSRHRSELADYVARTSAEIADIVERTQSELLAGPSNQLDSEEQTEVDQSIAQQEDELEHHSASHNKKDKRRSIFGRFSRLSLAAKDSSPSSSNQKRKATPDSVEVSRNRKSARRSLFDRFSGAATGSTAAAHQNHELGSAEKNSPYAGQPASKRKSMADLILFRFRNDAAGERPSSGLVGFPYNAPGPLPELDLGPRDFKHEFRESMVDFASRRDSEEGQLFKNFAIGLSRGTIKRSQVPCDAKGYYMTSDEPLPVPPSEDTTGKQGSSLKLRSGRQLWLQHQQDRRWQTPSPDHSLNEERADARALLESARAERDREYEVDDARSGRS